MMSLLTVGGSVRELWFVERFHFMHMYSAVKLCSYEQKSLLMFGCIVVPPSFLLAVLHKAFWEGVNFSLSFYLSLFVTFFLVVVWGMGLLVYGFFFIIISVFAGFL